MIGGIVGSNLAAFTSELGGKVGATSPQKSLVFSIVDTLNP